ncbi:transmembrane protein, putative (macronuclear) [Tetrahymena thermophila SB210]|uniref:Transmembrane protein, putative n=1 Tax=Tetrahymena thermophila (strain SB210) TaxID=312017 RepID=W7X156_TETTS|nr:transmembrane protein, putative [Tetrahymena thermophila SB210]EWS72940.1 transmembrane protein, putative [Tetrahymena thermophila SB210]|eukprot:XP_012654507.1 transmembrane protein, putative [Tetrahymena thermophila SB210]
MSAPVFSTIARGTNILVDCILMFSSIKKLPNNKCFGILAILSLLNIQLNSILIINDTLKGGPFSVQIKVYSIILKITKQYLIIQFSSLNLKSIYCALQNQISYLFFSKLVWVWTLAYLISLVCLQNVYDNMVLNDQFFLVSKDGYFTYSSIQIDKYVWGSEFLVNTFNLAFGFLINQNFGGNQKLYLTACIIMVFSSFCQQFEFFIDIYPLFQSLQTFIIFLYWQFMIEFTDRQKYLLNIFKML